MSTANIEIKLEQQMLCTCIGASFVSFCTTPLDVVKVRLQAQQRQTKRFPMRPNNRLHITLCDSKRLFSSVPMCFEHTFTNTCFKTNAQFMLKSHNEISRNIFKASMDLCRTIARKEGLATLWSGLTPALIMSVPGLMVYYIAYDRLKMRFGYNQPDPHKLYLPALAGAVSRVAAVTLVSPIELLRTKMQSTRLTYTQTFACLRGSIQQHGPSVLFRGLGPSLLRDVPFSTIYWISYEGTKIAYSRCHPDQTSPPGVTFISGALSGTLAAFLTCPFDVVKTHRQIELGEQSNPLPRSSKAPQPPQSLANTSTFGLLRSLYQTKGASALFAGVVPRLVKVAPACAIMITSYELGKKYFRQKNSVL